MPSSIVSAIGEPLTNALSTCRRPSSLLVPRSSFWRRSKLGDPEDDRPGRLLAWGWCLWPSPVNGSQRCCLLSVQDYTLGQLQQNEALRARQLCKTLSQLGPSFVKIGQALSSRPDLLPQVYLEVHPSFMSPTHT